MFDTPRRLVVSPLNLVGVGNSRRQTAEAVRRVGVQNGNDEGPPAVFGENHGEAGRPAGFRPSLAPQNSRRLRGEPALMSSRLRSNLRVPLSPVVRSFTLDPVENQSLFVVFCPVVALCLPLQRAPQSGCI